MQFHLFIIYLCKGQILIYDISFFAQISFNIFLMYSSPCHNVIHDIFNRITSIFKSNIFCIIKIFLILFPKVLHLWIIPDLLNDFHIILHHLATAPLCTCLLQCSFQNIFITFISTQSKDGMYIIKISWAGIGNAA